MTNSFDVPHEQVHGGLGPKAESYWGSYRDLQERFGHSEFHLLSLWPVYVRRIGVERFLAHYELFKMVLDLPGSIIDLGTSRGVSFFTWHKFLEIFCPTDTSRRVFGFDSFEGLVDFSEADGAFSLDADKKLGGWSASTVEAEVYELLSMHNHDSVLASKRGEIIRGPVQETLPLFVKGNPGLRIALLHLDMDLYVPTLTALEILWDLVLPGGLVVFDEFALPPWEGETRAWEDFAAQRGLGGLKVTRGPGSLTPSAFLVKP